jgi:hypothetical protein
MGKSQRAKGARGEREAAHALTAATCRPWRRAVGQHRHGADVPDVEPDGWTSDVWIEVKRGKRPRIYAALQQASDAACHHGMVPVALTRADGGPWLVTFQLEDIFAVAEMALGRRIEDDEEEPE